MESNKKDTLSSLKCRVIDIDSKISELQTKKINLENEIQSLLGNGKRYIYTDYNENFYCLTHEVAPWDDLHLIAEIDLSDLKGIASKISDLSYRFSTKGILQCLPQNINKDWLVREIITGSFLTLHNMYLEFKSEVEDVTEKTFITEREDLELDKDFVEWMGY